MRILHLSDLHLTEPFKSFEEIWSGPSARLQQGSFDFVIVSGDLSQAARETEYKDLDRFLVRDVTPLLKTQERNRIVLVPGNHDVDWNAELGDWLPLGRKLEDEGEKFLRDLKVALRTPEKSSDLRVSISAQGHVDVLKIDEARYAKRFASVQKFLDNFYADAARTLPPERFQPFRLTSIDDSEHWSAHVFREENTAFYCFNSCHRNDRYWTGAMLSPKAVEEARRHAERHAKGCILVAVWHHGLDSGRGRPDHLSADDLSLLYNAGFRIGFHGHTHQAAHETFDALFDNHFFVVSTGSLGAGSRERPDAVGNQFSVANVFEGHVDVEVFSRSTSNTYERNREQRRFLLQNANTARLDQQNHAVRHLRTWQVGANGIARVDIQLEDLTLRRELTLAVVEPPFGNIHADEFAQMPSGPRSVRREELPGGCIRYTLSAGNREEKISKLTWGYGVSNCLAISRVDLEARAKPKPPHEVVKPGSDGCPLTIRFPCDELILTLCLKDGLRFRPGSQDAMVLRRKEERGQEEQWVRVGTEERRESLMAHPDEPGVLRLTVSSPLVDYQYVITYAPDGPGESFSSEQRGLLDWLLEQCRDQMPSRADDSFPQVLATAIQSELERVLGQPLGGEFIWTGYIWKPSASKLLTAFGVFPNRLWSARFDWGSGVAGHALRFSQSASWAKEMASPEESLIYRAPPQGSRGGDYTWILCLPLLASPTRAIGVVSLGGHRQGRGAEQQLRQHVENLARWGHAHEAPSKESIHFQNQLFSAVNSAFWNVLSSWQSMTPGMEALVRRIAQGLEKTQPASPKSRPPASRRKPRGRPRSPSSR